MTNIDLKTPRLCGGTFFDLLLQAKQICDTKRKSENQENKTITEPSMFDALIRVLDENFVAPAGNTFKKDTSNYKKCVLKRNTYLPFWDRAVVKAFDLEMGNKYATLLGRMEAFTKNCLLTGSEAKMKWLVSAIMELIEEDTTIASGNTFLYGGKKVSFGVGFLRENEVYIPALLLAVWHFVIMCRSDVTVGEETFLAWHKGNKNSVKAFVSRIGEENVKYVTLQDKKEYTAELNGERSMPNSIRSGEKVLKKIIDQIGDIPMEDIAGGIDLKRHPKYKYGREYYNLFVSNQIDFDQRRIIMSLDRSLTEYTDEEAQKIFRISDKESIQKICHLPSIILQENANYKGIADVGQVAVFGFITKIEQDWNNLIFTYDEVNSVPQQFITDIADKIDAGIPRKTGELNRTHWAIKKLDVIQALDECGINWKH